MANEYDELVRVDELHAALARAARLHLQSAPVLTLPPPLPVGGGAPAASKKSLKLQNRGG